MKLYIAGLFLALAHLAASTGDVTQEENYDPNDVVDNVVKQWNQVASFLVETLHLPPIIDETSKLEEGILYGLNSLRRIGEAEGHFREGSQSLDFHVGFEMLALGFGRMTWNGEHLGSGIVRIADNSIHINFTSEAYSQERCYFIFQNFEWERFRDITLYSTDPEFNGNDLSKYENEIIDSANFATSLTAFPIIEGAVERYLCGRRNIHRQGTNVYPDINDYIKYFTFHKP